MKITEIITPQQETINESVWSEVGLWFSKKFGTDFALVAEKSIEELVSKGRLAGKVTRDEAIDAIAAQGKLGPDILASEKGEKLLTAVIDAANKERAPGLFKRLFGKAAEPAADKTAYTTATAAAKAAVGTFAAT